MRPISHPDGPDKLIWELDLTMLKCFRMGKKVFEFNPELVKTVKRMKRRKDKETGRPMSLRKISAALYAEGFTNSNGKKLGPSVIRDVLGQKISS